jgi:hypothetical protein
MQRWRLVAMLTLASQFALAPGDEVAQPHQILARPNVATHDRGLRHFLRVYQPGEFAQPDRIMRAKLQDEAVEDVAIALALGAATVDTMKLAQTIRHSSVSFGERIVIATASSIKTLVFLLRSSSSGLPYIATQTLPLNDAPDAQTAQCRQTRTLQGIHKSEST